eukprot:snap_masked-scaffold_14-processed-gene-2.36-mRNA-1 protein AED:1.00 eAED:1.00 QI:0/-1/0/0/-1/1/1/0/316
MKNEHLSIDLNYRGETVYFSTTTQTKTNLEPPSTDLYDRIRTIRFDDLYLSLPRKVIDLVSKHVKLFSGNHAILCGLPYPQKTLEALTRFLLHPKSNLQTICFLSAHSTSLAANIRFLLVKLHQMKNLKLIKFYDIDISRYEKLFLSFGKRINSKLERLAIPATLSTTYFLKGLEKKSHCSSLKELYLQGTFKHDIILPKLLLHIKNSQLCQTLERLFISFPYKRSAVAASMKILEDVLSILSRPLLLRIQEWQRTRSPDVFVTSSLFYHVDYLAKGSIILCPMTLLINSRNKRAERVCDLLRGVWKTHAGSVEKI